ncbi:MAG: CidA/LrgA family protein [Oscillospiraceae bacterium]|nr:CidA/LrgA family protein [Oscillospiraceae bacterium]
MKFLKQFSIIVIISFAGEALRALIPLPIPASVYGLVLMLALLCIGVLRVEHVRGAAVFLIEIMPVMFIPAAVGLMDSFGSLASALVPICVITVAVTVIVMAVTGRATQAVIRKGDRRK